MGPVNATRPPPAGNRSPDGLEVMVAEAREGRLREAAVGLGVEEDTVAVGGVQGLDGVGYCSTS